MRKRRSVIAFYFQQHDKLYNSIYKTLIDITLLNDMGPQESKDNSEMLEVQSESKVPCATFRTSHYYIMRTHITRAVML